MKDRLNRNIRDLRISVTDRCNFRCRYCMPEELYGEAYKFFNKDQVLTFEEINRIASIFIKLGVSKIRLTGGEPLVRSGIDSLVKSLAQIDKNIDLSMTTNGYLLEKYAKNLHENGLNRLTVSLDSLDSVIFQQMSGKNFDLNKVLGGLDRASEVGFSNIKINCVVKKGINDKGVIDLVDYCRGKNFILRFIEYMDVGTLNSWNKKYVLETKELKEIITNKFNILPVEKNYPSEVADRYEFEDGKGEIGFISSVSNPFCMNCTRARISTDGRFVTCLFSNKGVDIKNHLRNGKTDEEIMQIILRIWTNRDDKYSLERGTNSGKVTGKIEMFQLGG